MTRILGAVAVLTMVAQSFGSEPDYQPVFFTPEAHHEKIWGEPSLTFHDGTYYLIYDFFPHRVPFFLATSPDGVHWREEGEVLPVDDDALHIECPSVHRFEKDGPYVMQYAFTAAGNPSYRIRFAVSEDLRTWKKLGAENTFHPDPRWYDSGGRWDTQFVSPSPVGQQHLALWDGKPTDFCGLAFGKSRDGIRWDVLPPVEVRLPVPGPKRAECAGEIGGFHCIRGTYFLILSSYISGKYEPMVLSASDPEGPYTLTSVNPVLAPHPCLYLRSYRLPDDTIVAFESVLLHRDPTRYWCLPPLKQVVSSGKDLWLQWWPGNNKAKALPVDLRSGMSQREGSPESMLKHDFDLAKGVVIEGVCRLIEDQGTQTDLAKRARVSAAQTVESGNMPGRIRPEYATDGKRDTFWMSAGNTAAPNFYELDLGGVRQVGRIELQWLLPAFRTTTTLQQTPQPGLLQFSSNGDTWRPVDSAAGVHTPMLPSAGVMQFSHRSCWQDLDQQTRYVRIMMPPFCNAGVGIGLCEVNLYEAGRRDLGVSGRSTPGVFIECDNPDKEHYAILMERDGTVRLGFVGADGRGFRTEIRRKLEVDMPAEPAFRLLIRRNLGEFYLNEYFISSFKLGKPTGRIGVVRGVTAGSLSNFKAWYSDPDVARLQRPTDASHTAQGESKGDRLLYKESNKVACPPLSARKTPDPFNLYPKGNR